MKKIILILIVGMILISGCVNQTSQTSKKECSEEFEYRGCEDCSNDNDCETFCDNLCESNEGKTHLWTGYPATQFDQKEGVVCSCTCWYCV